MRRPMAIIFALGLGLAAAPGTARPAGAQEQIHGHSHGAAAHAPGPASTDGVRQRGGGLKLDVTSLNNSGIAGTATLRAVDGDKVEVDIVVHGAGAGPQPVHVHEGPCADLNPVPEIPLLTVTNGASTTELEGSLRQLTSTPHAIFMHKSPEELPIFVACADITLAEQLSAVPSTGDAGPLADLAAGLSGAGLALLAVGYTFRHRARRAWAARRRGAA